MATQNYSIDSTAIAQIGYDDEEEILYLTFKDGKSYELPGFSEIELARWLGAESKGGYFNAYVRGKY